LENMDEGEAMAGVPSQERLAQLSAALPAEIT
jgi:hypothetical protein